MLKKIGITIGNPNGVGPEVAASALKRLKNEYLKDFIVILDEETYNIYFKNIKDVEFYIFPSRMKNFYYSYEPGKKTIESGYLSFKFLEKAVEMIRNGKIDTLVTAPVSKELIKKSGVKNFVDHTTFLGNVFKKKTFMLFYSKDFSVILATIHIPLRKVSRMLTPQKLKETISYGIEFCKKIGITNPKIGVCGLNPHAGENGNIGKEEFKLSRGIQELKNFGYIVDGPIPADTAFYKAYNKQYDLIVAMYHDQGLSPFKMLHFNDGVNVTLGLPFVRTSPDHGTAFDIAGKGIANDESMLNAIELAMKLRGKS